MRCRRGVSGSEWAWLHLHETHTHREKVPQRLGVRVVTCMVWGVDLGLQVIYSFFIFFCFSVLIYLVSVYCFV